MPALQKDGLEAMDLDFSPDGKWLAIGGYSGAQVSSPDGRQSVLLNYPSGGFAEKWR
jgi:hypothetical protein